VVKRQLASPVFVGKMAVAAVCMCGSLRERLSQRRYSPVSGLPWCLAYWLRTTIGIHYR